MRRYGMHKQGYITHIFRQKRLMINCQNKFYHVSTYTYILLKLIVVIVTSDILSLYILNYKKIRMRHYEKYTNKKII